MFHDKITRRNDFLAVKMSITENAILNNSYRILKHIASGATGKTYLAENLSTQQKAAIKILNFADVKQWEEYDSFQSEMETLKELRHKHIPRYIEDFKTIINKAHYFCLVQEFVDGDNLQNLIKNGKRFTEPEFYDLFKTLLEILQYIHSRGIIHRDINPKNIILDSLGQPFLVDFGTAVKDCITETQGTFAGTLGYMAPEQLYGNPGLNSDIYSLGMTAVFVLTGKEPHEFELDGLKLNYKEYVNIPIRLRFLIDKMIITDAPKRIENAGKALSFLLDENPKDLFSPNELLHAPTGLKIHQENNRLSITAIKRKRSQYWFFALFTIIWNLIVFKFTQNAPIIMAVIVITIFGAIGLLLLVFTLYGLLVKETLTATEDKIKHSCRLFGIPIFKSTVSITGDITYEVTENNDILFKQGVYYTVIICNSSKTDEIIIGRGKGLSKSDAMIIQNALEKREKQFKRR